MAALFGAMATLAIIPSPSVFAVVARSIASGFAHGLVTVLGIMVGDLLFIILAIYGLSAIAETMNAFFFLVKYIGGAYLIWSGIKLWQSRSQFVDFEEIKESSWLSSFLSGLLITLGDSKAVFFYISFLPAFLELSSISIMDTIAVVTIATIAVGGSKLGYAYMGDRARSLFNNSKSKKRMNVAAASVAICTGIFLITKT